MKLFLLFIFSILVLNAGVIDDAKSRMGEQFPHSVMIQKHTTILNKEQKKELSRISEQKVKKSIFTYFISVDKQNKKHYGFIINSKIRSKSAAVIYFISSGKIKAIEILQFNEPREYLPREEWLHQFENKSNKDKPEIKSNITNISGATLSAKALVRQLRLALALYEMIEKEQ